MTDSERAEPVIVHLTAEDFNSPLFKALMAERELYEPEALALYQEKIKGIEWDNSDSALEELNMLYQSIYSFVKNLHKSVDEWGKSEPI